MALKNKISSKIIGIQFSLLSPEEIIRNSVAEIKYKETYSGNKPKTGGLFDLRMGTLEPGLICPTDNLNYLECPGYFGHIVLSKPVFYIQYLQTVTKILKCVCFKCSKLLIDKEEHQYVLKYDNSERWDLVYNACNKIKRCGEKSVNGCGCKQPDKIKKDGFATLFAEWGDGDEPISIKFTPELIIKIFKKISNEDVDFMGFSSKWSRPEWMICSVFAVPPPAVRPSVKVDTQQRSEDDLTHIIINIIKYNNILKDELANASKDNAKAYIDDWTSLLQYYVACLTDNNIPGTHPVTQRSGRPLKSIIERHKGKTGRVRGNLMGKRVDYSARSVITPDPELSITELGVPKKIAMNITKPIYVNDKNKDYLLYLIRNGPDKYPGAKILERKHGENISLRYVDKENITIEIGDIVHRHMLDGDYILFNRQPTLHRMSMMAHKVKVLSKGDTFRMNVADTKPYNADFDGDEMNMHMPQNDEAEMELKHLAAIKNQIISPATNSSIIGIFQDSLLGSYLFTEENITFTRKEAMNLIAKTIIPNISIFNDNKDTYTSHELVSAILPEITIKYNNTIIKNGKMISGQMNKKFFGGGNGMIQRINNDFSVEDSQIFIDNIQGIVTEYMKERGFSVGISDLITDDITKNKIISDIVSKKKDVLKMIDETHLGIFENKSDMTNKELFESNVNNVLNKATNEAGKIGLASLDKNNRFATIVKCGSKGSDINICQMMSCLGQQNIDNKRIPYHYQNRTLPHYKQFDDSIEARGFVESSFIEGLTPEEVFFHAMSGRVGLIDTAVKTSTTGYIQRRLIKGLEDIQICYDRTVRNNKQKIVQFIYGCDMDTVNIESYTFELLSLNATDIYEYYNYYFQDKTVMRNKILNVFNTKTKKSFKTNELKLKERIKKDIKYLIDERDEYIINVNEYSDDTTIYLSVHFKQMIENITNRFDITEKLCDIDPIGCYELIDKYYVDLEKVYKPCKLFKLAYYYYLNPKYLLCDKRVNKDILIYLLENIVLRYKKSIVNPGEMVGMIAAQSIGEPTTQMTLNTFHYAGVASKSNVTRGVPRMEELLTITSNIKNPSITVYMKEEVETNREYATNIIADLEHTKLNNFVNTCEIYYDPKPNEKTTYKEDNEFMTLYKDIMDTLTDCVKEENETIYNNWILRMTFDKNKMLDSNITVQYIHYALKTIYTDDKINCFYNDMNEDNIVFKIQLKNDTHKNKKAIDETDQIYMIKSFQDKLLNDIAIRGIKNIEKVNIRKIVNYLKYNSEKGSYEKEKDKEKEGIWVLDTVGSNLKEVLSLDNIDVSRTYSNSITEMKEVLGIEAARKCIFNEIKEVMDFADSYINYHHIGLLADRMTYNNKMVSIFRHGINNDNIGPIAKASFEETTEMFLKAAKHGELDELRGVSANVMCGQDGYYGTSSFSVYLNNKDIEEMQKEITFKEEQKTNLDSLLKNNNDRCSISKIRIKNNLDTITKNLEQDNDYELDL